MIRLLPASGLLFVALSSTSLGAAPLPSPTPNTTFELSAASQHLSNGSPNWASDSLSVSRALAPRRVLYGSLTKEYRFGEPDQTYLVGAYVPSSTNTILNIEASFSPTHAVVPQNELAASLDHRLADGWGYTVGVRHRSYTGLGVGIGSLIVDRYWKTFRVAYTLTGAQISNTPGTSLSHALSLTDYFGNNSENALTLSLNTGRDVENIGAQIVASAVSGISLHDSNWFSRRFGYSWTLSTLRQGTYYTRSGVQIGVLSRL